jgi:hypothetical protein
MDEKLDTVIGPHTRLPFPNLRDQRHLEIDPIRVDAIIDADVRLDPVSIHIARIEFLPAEASIDENVFNPSTPKFSDCEPQPFQEPLPPRSEPEPFSYFFQRCPMIARWQTVTRIGKSRPALFRADPRQATLQSERDTWTDSSAVNGRSDAAYCWSRTGQMDQGCSSFDRRSAIVSSTAVLTPLVSTPRVDLAGLREVASFDLGGLR